MWSESLCCNEKRSRVATAAVLGRGRISCHVGLVDFDKLLVHATELFECLFSIIRVCWLKNICETLDDL